MRVHLVGVCMLLCTFIHVRLCGTLAPHRNLIILISVLALKAYYILDELLVGGEIQETSKKNIIRAISAQDMLQEV